jgi:hypothetical protein
MTSEDPITGKMVRPTSSPRLIALLKWSLQMRIIDFADSSLGSDGQFGSIKHTFVKLCNKHNPIWLAKKKYKQNEQPFSPSMLF